MSEDMDDDIRGVAKGGAILFFGAFISKAIMYFYRVFVAQELGSADYGLLTIGLATFWITISFTHLGVTGGIQRKVSEFIGKNEEDRIPDIVWAALSSTLPLSLVTGSILFFFAEPISTVIFSKPEMTEILQIMAIAVPFQILYQNSNSMVKAFKKMRYVVYTDKLFKSLTTVGLTVALIYSGFDLLGAVVAQLVAIILSSLLITYFANTKVFPYLKKARSAKPVRERENLLRYSLPLFFSGIVALSMNWADTLLLGVLNTASEAGVYNAAFPTAQALAMFGGAISTMLFPTVSEYYGKGEKQESIELASIAVKWIFAVTFPGLILMILFSSEILQLLFGQEYTGGAIALSVLGTAYFLRVMSSHAGTYIKSEDWTKLDFYNSIVINIINLVLNVALIPMYGNSGAALATAFSMTLGSLIGVIEVWYFFDVQVYRIKKFVPAFLASTASIAIVYFGAKTLFETVPPLALFPLLGVFGVLYGTFFLLLGGLSHEDIVVLKEIDEKTPYDLEPAKKIIRKLAR